MVRARASSLTAALLLLCAAAAHAYEAPPAEANADAAAAAAVSQVLHAFPPPQAQSAAEQADGGGKASLPQQALESVREWQRGLASWYGKQFHGKRTASGEVFDMNELTAAHPSLPFGTVVRVRSLTNGRSVDVRINDRGPFIRQRIIDLSRAAAEALGLIEAGTGTKQVAIDILQHGDGDAPRQPARGRKPAR